MKLLTFSFSILLFSSVNVWAQEDYVAWTFDDFNENGEVVETVEFEKSLNIDIEYGELGW